MPTLQLVGRGGTRGVGTTRYIAFGDGTFQDLTGIDPERLQQLVASESDRFMADRPRSTALLERTRRTMPRGVPMSWMDDLYDHPPVFVTKGSGAHFTDLDGHEYLDMYLADMSAFCGHGPEPVVQAVAERMARGNQFLLPGEDAVVVAEHLAARYQLPKWQFTLSATQANTEIIRIARRATGRDVVLTFDGKYHGHLDSTMVVLDDGRLIPEYLGLPRGIEMTSRIIRFNDLQATERALATGDVAVVLTEPALTNAGFLLPEPGFHEELRRLTTETGTLLAIDETHTLVTAYAGLGRLWGLQPDFLTLGKSIAAGVPLAAYGLTESLASLLEAPETPYQVSGAVTGEVATGGTLFANALSMAAGYAALTEVLTEDAYARTLALGHRLAEGLRALFNSYDVPWSVTHEGSHLYYAFTAQPPRDGAASRAADDPGLRALIRLFMANRGIWESGWWLGPTVSVAHDSGDVDRYVAVFDEFLAATLD